MIYKIYGLIMQLYFLITVLCLDFPDPKYFAISGALAKIVKSDYFSCLSGRLYETTRLPFDIYWWHLVFECFLEIGGQEWSLIKPLKPTGYVMQQEFNIQQLYVLPTLYLRVSYLSENKQRLVPLTANTDWFL